MLIRFEVKNFKNFKEKLVLDLTQTNSYEFSKNAVKDGIVKTGIIYGANGSGKTNLGHAIFDITVHLTDKEKNISNYYLYGNLNNKNSVEFKYTFKFDNCILEYSYAKSDPSELISESLIIGGHEVLNYDYKTGRAKLELDGAEALNKNIAEKNISFVKYVNSNTFLTSNK